LKGACLPTSRCGLRVPASEFPAVAKIARRTPRIASVTAFFVAKMNCSGMPSPKGFDPTGCTKRCKKKKKKKDTGKRRKRSVCRKGSQQPRPYPAMNHLPPGLAKPYPPRFGHSEAGRTLRVLNSPVPFFSPFDYSRAGRDDPLAAHSPSRCEDWPM